MDGLSHQQLNLKKMVVEILERHYHGIELIKHNEPGDIWLLHDIVIVTHSNAVSIIRTAVIAIFVKELNELP